VVWAAVALLLAGASAAVALRLARRPSAAHVALPTVRADLDNAAARVPAAADAALLAVQPLAPDAAAAVPPRKAHPVAKKKRRPLVRAGVDPVDPKKVEAKVEPKAAPKVEPKKVEAKVAPKKVEPATKKPAPKKKFQDWVQDPPELR
jgi:outer membrane biosynthesis protein TonB